MSTNQYPLNLANGQQIIPVSGAGMATQQVILTCDTYPAAGTVAVELQMPGQSGWTPVYKGNNLPLTGPVSLAAWGPVARYRVTIAGLGAGGAGLSMWVSQGDGLGFPDGAFVGLRALTTQPYTEANVKNGVQYYARAVWPLTDLITAGSTRKIWVKTGAKQVLVKTRDFQYVAEELRLQIFVDPTGVTVGTALTIHNYNAINPVATTVQAKKNVTTVTDGTEIDGSDPEYFFGSANAAQRASNSIPQGRERVLPPNKEFIVAISNTGSGTARASYFLDWYEGGTDLPPVNP